MAKFQFTQDVKISVWQRQNFTIEAETEEEARKIVEKYSNHDVSNTFDEDFDVIDIEGTEILYDTQEAISVEENDGFPTIEMFTNNHGRMTSISTNVEKK